MKRDDDKIERRKFQRLSELGTNEPYCLTCLKIGGNDDWMLFESHHIAGRACHDFEWPFCEPCHKRFTLRQETLPELPTDPPTPIHRAGRFLLGLADIFDPMVAVIETKAAALERLARRSRSNRASIMSTVFWLSMLAAFLCALAPEVRKLGEALIDEDSKSAEPAQQSNG